MLKSRGQMLSRYSHVTCVAKINNQKIWNLEDQFESGGRPLQNYIDLGHPSCNLSDKDDCLLSRMPIVLQTVCRKNCPTIERSDKWSSWVDEQAQREEREVIS